MLTLQERRNKLLFASMVHYKYFHTPKGTERKEYVYKMLKGQLYLYLMENDNLESI